MIDSNTVLERQRDRSQARAESLHDMYGERVIQDVIETLQSGKKVCGLYWEDHAEGVVTLAELCALLNLHGDTLTGRKDTLRERVEESIRSWCEGPGASYVAELVREQP